MNGDNNLKQYYIEDDEVDLRKIIHTVIELLISQKIIIILTIVIVTAFGIIYTHINLPEDTSPEYEVNYFIQNGIRRFEKDEIILSINFETLSEWLKSRAYQFSRYLAEFDRHYEITVEIPENTELIKFVTYTSDTELPILYFESLIEAIENQPLFLQRIELDRQQQLQNIQAIKSKIELERIKLFEHQNRIIIIENEIELLQGQIKINEDKIEQIQLIIEYYEQLMPPPERQKIRRTMPAEKVEKIRKNLTLRLQTQEKIQHHKNQLNNIQVETNRLEKTIKDKEMEIIRLEKATLREANLNISVMEEEIELYKLKLDSIRLLNRVDDPIVFLPKRSLVIDKHNTVLIFIIVGVILGFVIAYIKEYSSTLKE